MKTRAAVPAILTLSLFGIAGVLSCGKSETPPPAPSASQTTQPLPQAPALPEQPPGRNPDRNAYFGETHIHTSWSVDAWVIGNRLTGPDDAYKYAQGETIKHPIGTTSTSIRPSTGWASPTTPSTSASRNWRTPRGRR